MLHSGALLDRGSRGRSVAEEELVNAIHLGEILNVVEIDVGCNYILEAETGFFETIQQVAHGLAHLAFHGIGKDAAVRARDESGFGGAVERIAGKDTGARGGAGRHVLRTHRQALAEIANRNAGELDVSASGQRGDVDGGSRGRVAELEILGVGMAHYVVADGIQHVWIYEDHVAIVQARGFQNRSHLVERGFHFG